MKRKTVFAKGALRGALCVLWIFLLICPAKATSVSGNEISFCQGGAWEKDTGYPIAVDCVKTPRLNSYLSEKKQKSKFPKKYDPRNKDFITPIKDQGQTGLCWAFAGCSQIESSLIKLNNATSDTDISELQMAYFGYLSRPDEDQSMSFLEYCLSGSGSDNMKNLLMQGTGPILEREETAPAELTDDFSLPDDYIWLSDYALLCYWRVDFSNIEEVKSVVDQCGGVCGYYHSDKYHYIDLVNKKKDTSFYHDGCQKSPNHAIDVIGWNDNFPKEKFADTPPSDGAWLCKNSWGENGYYSEDGSGFYWISYYEPSLSMIDGFAAGFHNADICRDNVYEISGKSATLESCVDTENPVIPSVIQVGSKKIKVEYISETFFKGSQSLYHITLGKNIKVIFPETFKGCKNLSGVSFGKNLTYIGTGAFRGCSSLSSVNIPDKTYIIEDKAFYGCRSLSKVTIGTDTYRIGDKTFYGCKHLKTLKLRAGNLHYIGKKAFKGTPKSMKIKTKKAYKKSYKKMIKKAK